MRFSISLKVWMTTTALVLVVLLLLGYLLESQFSGYYYRWQEARMVREAQHLAMLAADGELHNAPQKIAHYEAMLGEKIILAEKSRELAGCLPFDYVAEETLISREERTRIVAGETVVKREYSQRIGAEVLAVVTPISSGDRMMGAVFLYSTTEEIDQAVDQFRLLFAYTAAAVLVVGGLSSILLARTLTHPVIRLRKTTEELEKGEYDKPLQQPRRKDELGDLERSLEHLRQTLQEKTANVARQEEVRREFVANVSHELRTPLSYIQGYLEAILDGVVNEPDERENYLRIILEETLRMRRLVDDLLDLQSLAAGRSSGPKEVLQPLDCLQDVYERFLPVAREKGIHLLLDTQALPDIRANRDRLEQVLINLLGNSLRFTPSGGEIRLKAAPKNGGIEISVADNGPGIPPEILERIWERFYKGDESRHGGGSGLGLAIAKSIVEEHGGTIEATSHPGQGAVFTFWLPSC